MWPVTGTSVYMKKSAAAFLPSVTTTCLKLQAGRVPVTAAPSRRLGTTKARRYRRGIDVRGLLAAGMLRIAHAQRRQRVRDERVAEVDVLAGLVLVASSRAAYSPRRRKFPERVEKPGRIERIAEGIAAVEHGRPHLRPVAQVRRSSAGRSNPVRPVCRRGNRRGCCRPSCLCGVTSIASPRSNNASCRIAIDIFRPHGRRIVLPAERLVVDVRQLDAGHAVLS